MAFAFFLKIAVPLVICMKHLEYRRRSVFLLMEQLERCVFFMGSA